MLGKGKQMVERAGGLIKDEALGLIRDAKETKGPLKEKALGLVKGRSLGLLKQAKMETVASRREEGTAKDHTEYFRSLIRETNKRSTRAVGERTWVDESQDQAGGDLPIENYDSMGVRQVREKLDDLSVEGVKRLRAYEAKNKNRRTLLERFDRRIEAGSS